MLPSTVVDESELSIFDINDERSIVNLVPQIIREQILSLQAKSPELIGMGEADLRNRLNPSDSMDTLRLAFWNEYNRAQDTGSKMKGVNIYSPVMGKSTFYEHYLVKPEVIAWLLCPPQDHILSMQAYLNKGKENLAKLLKMNIHDEDGKVNPKAAQVFLKAYELVENRVLGAVTQRIEQKTQSMHIKAEIEGSGADLKKELEELRSKRVAIDVSPVKDDPSE